jgi:hypothetical protein
MLLLSAYLTLFLKAGARDGLTFVIGKAAVIKSCDYLSLTILCMSAFPFAEGTFYVFPIFDVNIFYYR